MSVEHNVSRAQQKDHLGYNDGDHLAAHEVDGSTVFESGNGEEGETSAEHNE